MTVGQKREIEGLKLKERKRILSCLSTLVHPINQSDWIFFWRILDKSCSCVPDSSEKRGNTPLGISLNTFLWPNSNYLATVYGQHKYRMFYQYQFFFLLCTLNAQNRCYLWWPFTDVVHLRSFYRQTEKKTKKKTMKSEAQLGKSTKQFHIYTFFAPSSSPLLLFLAFFSHDFGPMSLLNGMT